MKFFIIVIMSFSISLYARGVKAGTVIKNQATLNFSIGSSISYTLNSNEVQNVVSQLLNPVLKWQDSSDVSIYEGAKNKVLTLSILNDGNGKDRFKLFLNEDSTFSPFIDSITVYLDTNNNGVFDERDTKTDEITLESDKQSRVFIVTSLKERVENDNKTLNVDITAKSLLGGSGIKGTIHKGSGVDGVDTIDGINGGISNENVYYKFFTQQPKFTKSIQDFEKDGYFLVTLRLDITGNTTLKNLHLTDMVPKGLYYRKNSVRLNNIYQSDKKDEDFANFDFKRNILNLNLSEVSLSKNILITYILDKEVR